MTAAVAGLLSALGRNYPMGGIAFDGRIKLDRRCCHGLRRPGFPRVGKPADTAMLVLYGGLPTAMSSYVLSSQLGGDKETMAQIITLQTLLAALTLPIVLLAIQKLL